MISAKALDCKIYHPVRAAVPWGKTYLRNWLVNTFANMALNPAEQRCIVPQKAGNVMDTVSMLNEDQIIKYQLAEHGCDVTAYAANLPDPVNINQDGYGCWWVRMDKTTANPKVQFVGRGGYVYASSTTKGYRKSSGGNYTTSKDNGIRPTMLLSMSALRECELSDDFAVVSGSVVNASNPTIAISGVPVQINGTTVFTDAFGSFAVGVEPGWVDYSVNHEDYIPVNDTVEMLGGQNTLTIAVTKRMAPNEYRVVLTWGAVPRDLDSHLTGKTQNGSGYHVYFNNLRADGGKALLEWDDTTSYGPETTHFFAYPGQYYLFSIHDYTNRGSHSCS